jgi:CelD/BcsL family acetyltransferase involved in cellulose biosynthesis
MRLKDFTVTVLERFDDPLISPARWTAVLRQGSTDAVFLTWHWQRAWWDTFARGRLLLIAVECEGELRAIAPLFTDEGMIFFVGSGGSDYLDFVGDIREPNLLGLVLDAARASVPDFLGFRFYHVPDESRSGGLLKAAGTRLNLHVFDEGDMNVPVFDFTMPANGPDATRKKSLQRHESFFRRDGTLKVLHLQNGAEIQPHLKEFFEQHIDRWKGTASRSLFEDLEKQEFYQKLTEVAGDTGWLRFTRLDWNNKPIAFHFGTCYRGNYLWYKPSFAIDLARRSPGEVLLRQLLLAARDENARVFDFGLGDEKFKFRFANCVRTVRTWGLYPARALPGVKTTQEKL